MGTETPSEQLHLIKSSETMTTPGEQMLTITDPDLIEMLESTPAGQIRALTEKRLLRVQKERNEKAEKRSAMTPIERRRDLVSEQLKELDLQDSDVHHIHSVLALCALPYKRPKADSLDYQARYGYMSLNVQPGSLTDPRTGDWVRQGVPYGPKARLVQMHICTRALRQKSPIVEMEDNMTSFIRNLGFSVTGGKNGTITLFKEQLNRLAACRLQIGLWNGVDQSRTINIQPIKSLDVWFPNDPDQKMLWPSKVVLSQEFYDSLTDHALPVDIRAMGALSHSAKQMDLMLWLSYRLKGLKKNYFLTWELLKDQFCQSKTMRMIDFQKRFKDDLNDIQAVFDRPLPIQLSDKGMLLKPSDPKALFVPPKRLRRGS